MPVTIGKLFPPADVVARWMFNVSVIVDDLQVLDHQLQEVRDRPLEPRGTFYRLIGVRIFEAERIVHEIDTRPEVTTFLLSIPGARTHVTALRDAYAGTKASPSLVRRTFQNARHLTVHYPDQPKKPGELAKILRASAALEAQAVLQEDERFLRFLWANEVYEQWLWPNEESWQESLRLAASIVQHLTQLFLAAFPAYCVRVDVDYDEITHFDRKSGDIIVDHDERRRRARRPTSE